MLKVAGMCIMVVVMCGGCLSGVLLKEHQPSADSPLALFNQRAAQAEWLARYRAVMHLAREEARKNPPAGLVELSRDAFCFETENGWFAVFGKFDAAAEAFQEQARYMVDPTAGTVLPVPTDEPFPRALPYLRTLEWSYRRVIAPNLESDGLLFDQFIRTRADGSLELWILPGWQPNGFVLHGRTLLYVFTQDGQRVLHQEVWDYGLTGLRPGEDKRYQIGHTDYPAPPVGDLYFILYYGGLFQDILTRSQQYTSTIATIKGERRWVHMALGGRETLLGPIVPSLGPDIRKPESLQH